MDIRKTIKVISPYFGEWPWYFKYFLHSCSFNPGVEFLVVSDIPFEDDLPPNVKLLELSLHNFKELASEKLGFEVVINDPYKLCDFKPAYGHIFEDYLLGYDYWGHGDIDIIFGNLANFISEPVNNNYDVIYLRHDFITGYFTLFKNTGKINALYRQSKDYEKIFMNARHFCFDETNFSFTSFADGIHYSKISSEIESMMHVIKRLQENQVIQAYFDFHVIEGTPGRLTWINGSLFYKNKFEVALYHMIKFKYNTNIQKHKHVLGNNFKITPTRIIQIN
ncbi:hypothetical protein Lbys_1376 [Leadbetterella byssophila DSM 17132]|uniref:Glycosyltransferase n=1 Tax=Leadbetterella byssophila (strain DSM 17132 / JCM 16389 / KACC 11308 / NBRC 106382 / 4M15) TaxID=649349 RepID=E4RW59_LEAB4|nr:DUF6625 family protein [Leadbetterella byssophila]ADQ17094.1 hypothetical protein Lbys_1376 [Leadbetterella byssophila DSM 17132]